MTTNLRSNPQALQIIKTTIAELVEKSDTKSFTLNDLYSALIQNDISQYNKFEIKDYIARIDFFTNTSVLDDQDLYTLRDDLTKHRHSENFAKWLKA